MYHSLSGFKYISRAFVLTVMIVCLNSSNAIAQLNYTSFLATSSSDLSFLGDSEINGTSLRLIRAQSGGGNAAIWYKTKHRVTDGFVAMFTFRIVNATGSPNGGADGFTFMIQNSSTSDPLGKGGPGGNIGYGKDTNPQSPAVGIVKSIAVEFDTYKNLDLADPDNNHISVHSNLLGENNANESFSNGRVSLGTNPNLRDGVEHLVRIEYDGATSTNPFQWRIYIGNLTTPRLTLTKNISTIIGTGETDAYVGFTAGSAFEWENHEITNWSFSPRFLNLPAFTAPDADVQGTQTVSTSEYHPGADANNYNVNGTIDTAVLPDRKTELWAKYYFPNNLSGGQYPIVILHHGNHDTCGIGVNPRVDHISDYTTTGTCPGGYVVSPSHRGYDYLATKLASHGYIVVSINSNLGITGSVIPYQKDMNPNFPEYTDDDNLILIRGRLVLRHLQKLSEWNAGFATLASSTTLNSSTNTGKTGWFGAKIVVGSSPVLVRSIGRMYLNGNSGNHTLRIVRASDNVVVATTSVTMNNWNHGQFKYNDLASPVTLAANTIYYLVSQEQAGGDKYSRTRISPSSIASITPGGIRSYDETTWKKIGGDPYTIGVDLRYETASTTPTELGVNLKGKIDFSNVGLMGHSRGGEGMRAAYELYREANSPWQSRIISPMTVKGIFEFAPTDRMVVDRNFNLIRLLNADGTAWNVVVGACDGDLFYLPGVKPFDRMLKINSEPTAKPKSIYYVYGANHNFFNTQWQRTDSFNNSIPPIDFNGCLGPSNNPLFLNPISDGAGGYGTEMQRKTGSSPFMAFMRGNVGNTANPAFNQNFDPKFNVPSNISSITKVERSYTPSPNTSQTLKFQDLEFPPLSTNLCSQSGIVCNSGDLQVLSTNVQVRPDVPSIPVNTMNHDEDFLAANLSWINPSPLNYFQTNWVGSPSVDVSAYQNLEFRVSRRRNSISPLQVDALNVGTSCNFSIQLVMENGTISKAIGLNRYLNLDGPVGKTNHTYPPLPTPTPTVTPTPTPAPPIVSEIGELHPILRTVRIPLSDFLNSDLTKIKGIRLIFNDTSKGAINLSNLRFSK
jgi:Legume lectin domain